MEFLKTTLPVIFLGGLTGVLSGMLGVGGALFVIPALVVFFGFSQGMAQGTALAMMLPPMGILGVLVYHQKGLVDVKTAIVLCIASAIGTFAGSKLAMQIPISFLQKIFGFYLIGIGLYMVFFAQSK
jgi:uncharacterized protein